MFKDQDSEEYKSFNEIAIAIFKEKFPLCKVSRHNK